MLHYYTLGIQTNISWTRVQLRNYCHWHAEHTVLKQHGEYVIHSNLKVFALLQPQSELITYRTSVFQDSVSEAVVTLSPDVLSVGTLEDECFLQVATLFIFVGHAILAVEGDILDRLFGQKSDQLHLNGHSVGLVPFVAIVELKSYVGQVSFRKNIHNF